MMSSLFLLLAAQSVAAPVPHRAAPVKEAPTIYALVYVERRVKMDREWSNRKDQMIYEMAHFLDAFNAVLKAGSVSDLSVVRKQKDARAWLEKNIRVESLQDTGVLRVSLAEGLPAEQVAIVNAVAKAYVKEATERERLYRERQIADLRKRCDGFRESLRIAGDRLAAMNGYKVADEDQWRAITEVRNRRAKWIRDRNEALKATENTIDELRKHLRKPFAIVLESAEFSPKWKR
jgi:hypothetical protein